MAQGSSYIRDKVVPLPENPKLLASNKVTFPREYPSIPPGYRGFLPGKRVEPGVGCTFGHFSSEEIRKRRVEEQPAGIGDWDWKFPFNRMKKDVIKEENPWTLPSQRVVNKEDGMQKWQNYPFFLANHFKHTVDKKCFNDQPFTEYHKKYLKVHNPYLESADDGRAAALKARQEEKMRQKTSHMLW